MKSRLLAKRNLIVILMASIALLPVVSSKMFDKTNQITMYQDDNKKMEKEIIRVIPLGSDVQFVQTAMKRNRFTLLQQTPSSLEFEKEEGGWLFYEGTLWSADFIMKKGKVSNVKVWIQPAGLKLKEHQHRKIKRHLSRFY